MAGAGALLPEFPWGWCPLFTPTAGLGDWIAHWPIGAAVPFPRPHCLAMTDKKQIYENSVKELTEKLQPVNSALERYWPRLEKQWQSDGFSVSAKIEQINRGMTPALRRIVEVIPAKGVTTNKAIAEALVVAVPTIKSHMQALARLLETSNRLDMVLHIIGLSLYFKLPPSHYYRIATSSPG